MRKVVVFNNTNCILPEPYAPDPFIYNIGDKSMFDYEELPIYGICIRTDYQYIGTDIYFSTVPHYTSSSSPRFSIAYHNGVFSDNSGTDLDIKSLPTITIGNATYYYHFWNGGETPYYVCRYNRQTYWDTPQEAGEYINFIIKPKTEVDI